MKTRVTVTFQMDVEHANHDSLNDFVLRMQQEYWLNREWNSDGIRYDAELVDGTLSVETI